MGLSPEEAESVVAAARETGALLTVGYNRRFSAHTEKLREAFDGQQGPLALHYTVAAGAPPAGSWITDPVVGGGRIVGEVCHFVDLCTHLVGQAPRSVFARGLGRDPEHDDSVSVSLGFADGSAATIDYLARTSSALPKERLEVSGEGRTLRCDNFRTTAPAEGKAFKTLNQDKGQAAAIAATLEAVRRGGASPIPLEQIDGVSRGTFAIVESIASGQAVTLD